MISENRVPTHPGAILLKDFLRPTGIGVFEFAGYTGIQQNRLVEFCQQSIDLTFSELIRIALATGTTKEFWFGLQGDYRFAVDNLQPHLPPMPEFVQKETANAD